MYINLISSILELLCLPIIAISVFRSLKKLKTLLYAAWAVVTVMAVTMLVVLYLMPAHPEPWGPISIALSLMAAAFLAAVHAQHTRMRIAQRAGIPTA